MAKPRYRYCITYPLSTDRPSKNAYNNKPKPSMSRVAAVKPKQRTTRRTKSVRQEEDGAVEEHECVNEEQHESEVS